MSNAQQIPCFFLFLLGLFMWLNFLTVNAMYIYWPVALVGLTLIILFLPFRVLYHRSRQWWAYSNVSVRHMDWPSTFTNENSGVWFSRVYILLNFVISFLETCTVPRRMLWA